MMPTAAAAAEIVLVESRLSRPPDFPSSERQSSQPVTLVPIFAPMTIGIDCATVISEELTKPTTIAEVAEEDCTAAVTNVPSRTPLIGVPESFQSTSSSRFPAAFFRPSPMICIPNRNSATPPSSEITLAISICFRSFSSLHLRPYYNT